MIYNKVKADSDKKTFSYSLKNFSVFKNEIEKNLFEYSITELTYKDIIAIIIKESGSKALKNYYNDYKVVGDNGNAYGIMQQWQDSLTDVNSKFKFNFSVHDLQNYKTAIKAGLGYIKIALNECKKDNVKSDLYNVSARYNGGAYSSDYNDNAKKYANNVQKIRANL